MASQKVAAGRSYSERRDSLISSRVPIADTSGGCHVANMTDHTTIVSSRADVSLKFNRRAWLKSAAALCGATAVVVAPTGHAAAAAPVEPDFRIRRGRIRQSIMGWTFNPMPTPELAKHCQAIGLVAMEGIDAKHYPLIRELGLGVSLVSSHGFAKGPFNPAHHEQCERSLREGIDLAVRVQCQNVITFTGMREPGISDEAGARNCVELWKRVIGYAEVKKVNLCLEHLNSRDDTHPMKGHPGYFGDHVDFCVELIRRVGSPNMKL